VCSVLGVVSKCLLSALMPTDDQKWASREPTTNMRATVTLTDAERKVHHLRVSTTPDPDQRQIFDSLGISDPLPRRAKVVASL